MAEDKSKYSPLGDGGSFSPLGVGGSFSPLGDGGGAGGMIFAAGLGTRFKPWTDQHPKALALINGKSLLQHNIGYLQHFGITEVVVNVHHFAEQVIEAVKKNNGWGSKIIISNESGELLETGGGLINAKNLLRNDKPFVTINVDILTDLNLYELFSFHRHQKPLISFAVTERKTSRYFLFDENNRLCGWRNTITGEEKIVIKKSKLFQKAYSCVVIFEPAVFSINPLTGKFSLTDMYLALASDHVILGYDHSGDKFVDVGKPESISKAESLFH